jgi:hypothetical protein
VGDQRFKSNEIITFGNARKAPQSFANKLSFFDWKEAAIGD